ncbi:MAG: hypothetical protein JST21_00465 [Bacteroidetes bacterium]|nr:hypothetical protein [Bacteroidota bacterium]
MKRKFICLISIIAFALAYSCVKQNLKLTSSNSTQQNARTIVSWLNSQKDIFADDSLWIDSIANSLEVTHQQSTILDTNENLVIIPLELLINKHIGNTIFLKTTQTKLLLIKNKIGNILSGKIVAITSQNVYNETYIIRLLASMLKGDSIYDGHFNGTVSLLRLNRSLVYQAMYTNGKFLQRKFLQKADYLTGFGVPQYKNFDRESATAHSDVAKCTDWYLVIYNYETGEIISVTYEYTVCDGDGGEGGGGASGEEDFTNWELGNGKSPFLCTRTTYSMAKVGNSFTGQIDELGMSLIGPNGEFMNIEFGSSCISIPFYNITAAQASAYFVHAYNAAVDDAILGLDDGSILPKSITVKLAFKNKIVSRLNELKPGSSMSTGVGCGGSVPISAASYC